LEVRRDSELVRIERPLTRALLACLLLHPNQPVPPDGLIDDLWGATPPRTALASLQNEVSRLRKAIGFDRIRLLPEGYLLRVDIGELDVTRFELLVREADHADADEAVATLEHALGLWRGPPLAEFAYESFAQPATRRLEELRLATLERRIDVDLRRGHHGELVAELEALTREHPLRERFRAQLMIALYRCGRQVEALEVYRAARSALVKELGIEPSPVLQELERAILRQDLALDASVEPPKSQRSLLVGPLDDRNLDRLLLLAEPLAHEGTRELILALVVANDAALDEASSALLERREPLRSRGAVVRSAAFTSATPGTDLVRLANEQDVDLLVVDAPPALLADHELVTVLAHAPCDVAVVTCDRPIPETGSILVPFGGAEHDWAAIEVGAWCALARSIPLVLAGPTAETDERDASRLLATAALAVDRALGVVAQPLLLDPDPTSLVRAADTARLVVIGLSHRWRQSGLGAVRMALVEKARPPTVLVRQGLRPSGLVPDQSLTRFTWSIAPPRLA
jgi:DNA-binding SARP family transcriptional activator